MGYALNRRKFLRNSATAAVAAGAIAASGTAKASLSANDKIVVGVMGLGRGRQLTEALTTIPNAELAYLCEVDSKVLAHGMTQFGKQRPALKAVGDFRRILDDKSVDALVIAAPDHWHVPATLMACEAGKNVYVEKPCSHNPREGELAIAAARKYNRTVQVGIQRRSFPAIIEAVDKIRAGVIGRVLYARGWYNNRRASIGRGKIVPVPASLDYSLWQGPAPERPYKDNFAHYNWRWFWNWGTGELGNNGVHALDMCRWALGVDYPARVTSGGGRIRYNDDGETPDTQTVTYDFGGKTILWEGLSWSPRGIEIEPFGATFHGERGTIVVEGGSNYVIYDMTNKEIGRGACPGGNVVHMVDFLDSIREGRRPNGDIEEGHKSTMLCHLGNIAWRVDRVLHCDQTNGHILHDDEAMRLWKREYRPGWEPKGLG